MGKDLRTCTYLQVEQFLYLRIQLAKLKSNTNSVTLYIISLIIYIYIVKPLLTDTST